MRNLGINANFNASGYVRTTEELVEDIDNRIMVARETLTCFADGYVTKNN